MDLLFDISGNDISMLTDSDLRIMVGLLCEAEFQHGGLSVSDVTWGGHQNASDGGLDVVVKSVTTLLSNSFIPRNNTGLQVKKPDMGPAEIKHEMRPDGVLRDSIKNLIKNHGAYIIASAGSVSAKSLDRRITAMREAISDQPGHQNLHLDYYDSSRLASWVRLHPSLILWLRSKISRHFKGWQRFGNWSGKTGVVPDKYILDENFRLRHVSNSEGKEMNTTEGILQFRSLLSTPIVSLRLTGLSGVGKTRFVQAVFEDIEGEPLNPNLAIYTDMSDGPSPDPSTLAEQLKAQGVRAILIIDNCLPELHRRLTVKCCTPESKISLLTIEYDVRDDLPEETDVFILEPSSEKVIQSLIVRRFPEIGQVNARTIAEFSSGNARVAIALAGTVKKGEALSTLRDDNLFVRLFKQRNTEDESLQIAAEVCSLVYSFEGTKIHEEDSELKFLGRLINIHPEDLYRKVSTLKKRNLVQSRDVWRAILPHAISNRLAKKALESIPINIINSFEQFAPKRLFKSFSRRLGYLHDSNHAIQIATDWLSPNGLLGKTNGNLSDFGMTVLANISPLAQQSVLEFMERAANGEDGANYTSRGNHHFNEIIKLLSLMAYDPTYFNRSAKLICRFALTEKTNENNNSIRYQLGTLFQLYISGTHATFKQRTEIISDLLYSSNEKEQDLGLFLLEKSLKTRSFTGSDYSFGARSRDSGFHPKTKQDTIDWYDNFVALGSSLSIQNGGVSKQARTLLGNNFRSLWRVGLFDLMERTSKIIHKSGPWNDGWIGIKSIFLYDKENYADDIIIRLKALEELLRPTTLIDQARTIALTNRHYNFEFETIEVEQDNNTKTSERMHEKAKEIGSKIVQNSEMLNTLLPELLSTDNERLYNFGEGVGAGSNDLNSSWKVFYKTLELIPLIKRQYRFLIGFLKESSARDPKFFHNTLDSLVEDKLFGPLFPYFQGCLGIDLPGIERLKKSLTLGIADIRVYQNIEYAWFHESVQEDNYIELLDALLDKQKGVPVVIETLYNKLHGQSEKSIKHSKRLIDFTGTVLGSYSFTETPWKSIDHCLNFLVKECLHENEKDATQMCIQLKASIRDNSFHHDYRELVLSLATVHPIVFLNVFFGQPENEEDYLDRVNDRDNNPFDIITEKDIETWCDNHIDRIPSILTNLTPYNRTSESGKVEWKPIVFRLLVIAPDLKQALTSLWFSVELTSWDGLTTNILEEHFTLLKELEQKEIVEISDWAKETQIKIKERARSAEETEKQNTQRRNETFE